eukprot:scaffold305045_cov15-Tisochrysis_lutea.AAC.1
MVLVTKPVQAGGQEENIELTDLKSITAFQVRELMCQLCQSHLLLILSSFTGTLFQVAVGLPLEDCDWKR